MGVSTIEIDHLTISKYRQQNNWLYRHEWSSELLLKDLSNKRLSLNGFDEASVREELWRNLVAEFDAIHLSKQIHAKKNSLSPEFLEFEGAWLKDELNHYKGLRRIFSLIFDIDENALDKDVRQRVPDFSIVEKFLKEEFILCVCFAYDELASTKGYADAFSLYDSFGEPSVSKWIRLTARDEMFHCLNAQYIIKQAHADRLHDVPATLRMIVEHENPNPEEYRATFLFDHGNVPGSNPFSKEFLQDCANEICRHLRVPPAFLRGDQ